MVAARRRWDGARSIQSSEEHPLHFKRHISILAAAISATAFSGAAIAAQTPTQAPVNEIPTLPGQPVPVPLGPCQFAIQLHP